MAELSNDGNLMKDSASEIYECASCGRKINRNHERLYCMVTYMLCDPCYQRSDTNALLSILDELCEALEQMLKNKGKNDE